MEISNRNERTLAYKASYLIERDELSDVCGGAVENATGFTTKQTVDNMGNWDVGGDVSW